MRGEQSTLHEARRDGVGVLQGAQIIERDAAGFGVARAFEQERGLHIERVITPLGFKPRSGFTPEMSN
jgi:hypothetical protein